MLLSKISLASLRTFTEVARHGSLSVAATQLCISPSAVSHQMKLLEQKLGVALLVRRTRGVALTDAGRHLGERAIIAMQHLESGLQASCDLSKQQLTVVAIPALVQLWIVPRLHRFYAQHPNIELRLLDQDDLCDFSNQFVDVHLHFGSGEFVGLKAEMLMQEWAVPIASPDLLANFSCADDLFQSPDVRRFTYLGFDEDRPGGLSWEGWSNKTGVRLNEQQKTTQFNHLAPMYTAVALGQGIALGWGQLIEKELAAKRLVALSQMHVPLKYSYYGVAPEHHFEREPVKAFLSWMKRECEENGSFFFNN